MANSNKDKTCAVIDLIYNNIVYAGSYKDCYQFFKAQGDNYFLYKIELNYGKEI